MNSQILFLIPSKKLLRYGIVGVVNTVVSMVIILTLHKGLGLGLVLSNAIGYTIGLVQSFFLNRRWTFEHTGAALRAIVIYGIVVLVSFVASMIMIIVLIALGIDYFIGQSAGVVTYSTIAFLGLRNLAFRTPD